MKKTGFLALTLATVLAFTPAAPVLAEETATETKEITVTSTPEPDHYWDGLYYIKNGKKVKGLQTIGKKQYYFGSDYKLVKNRRAFKLKVNGKTGYYNISAKGVVTQWTGTAALAAKRLVSLKANLNSVTSKTKLASLKKAFLWSAGLKYVNNTKNYTGTKAAKYYGDYGFKNVRGDCNTQAYTFYWMAKVLGYDAKVVKGYIPTAADSKGNPTNFKAHAWTEIKFSGKTYVFDPNFNTSSDARAQRATNKYVGFKFTYGTKGTYWYHDAKKKSLVKR